MHRAIVHRDSDLEGADRRLDRQRLRARWPPGRLEPRLIAYDILPHRQKARLCTGRLRDVESDRRRLVHQREVSVNSYSNEYFLSHLSDGIAIAMQISTN